MIWAILTSHIQVSFKSVKLFVQWFGPPLAFGVATDSCLPQGCYLYKIDEL